jgi:hypothetical protein
MMLSIARRRQQLSLLQVTEDDDEWTSLYMMPKVVVMQPDR